MISASHVINKFETMCLIFLGAALTVAACSTDSDSDREPLPDWSDGYGDGADVPDAKRPTNENIIEGRTADLPLDSFGLGIPDDVDYPVRLRKMGTAKEPCAVREGGRAEVTCVMEMDELDIYGLGIVYDIASPVGMCDFVIYCSYIYENWPFGFGPSEVSWVIDPDAGITDEVNSKKGIPYCEFDYSGQFFRFGQGPNCCMGNYMKTVTNRKTGEMSTSVEYWGGKPADCYDGAAFLDKEAVFDDGDFPMCKIMRVNREEFLKRVEYEILSDKYPATTVPLANYWDPADHDGGIPAAFGGPASQPFYEFECADDAWEIIARIHLVVRDWNEEAEFDKDGDPDTVGIEPYWNHEINDLADWADLTPGNSEYPKLFFSRDK